MAVTPLTSQEQALSYSKFYSWAVDMPTQEEEKTFRSPMGAGDVIQPQNFLRAFTESRTPQAENKHCVLQDGTIYAHVMVELPDCTDEMMGWWFQWFPHAPRIEQTNGNLRYRLWDPLDHWDTIGNVMVESFDDGAGGPKYYTDHKYIPLPSLGLPDAQIQHLEKCGVWASCLLNSSEGMADRIVVNLNQPRPGGGVMMRTHYWFNCTIQEGRPRRDGREQQFSEELACQIHRHNLVEKRHLNKFLPALFAEQGHKPVKDD